MQQKKIVLLLIIAILSACAKGSKEISSSYVSPLQFNNYSCNQLEAELASLNRRVSDLGGIVDEQKSGDQLKTGVGVILFFPTLFFLDGKTPQATEYARLKGEYEALERAMIQKNCKMNNTVVDTNK